MSGISVRILSEQIHLDEGCSISAKDEWYAIRSPVAGKQITDIDEYTHATSCSSNSIVCMLTSRFHTHCFNPWRDGERSAQNDRDTYTARALAAIFGDGFNRFSLVLAWIYISSNSISRSRASILRHFNQEESKSLHLFVNQYVSSFESGHFSTYHVTPH